MEHFDNKRYYSNGLTIPFLIGSATIFQPTLNIVGISTFVDQLVSKELPEYVSVLKCGNIGEYVFGILDFETKEYVFKYPDQYKTFGGLVFADRSLEHIGSIEDLKELFQKEYESRILNKTYSKNGAWGCYSETECARLKEVLLLTG